MSSAGAPPSPTLPPRLLTLQILLKTTPLTPVQVLRLGDQIAERLERLHDSGRFHHHLCPQGVILDPASLGVRELSHVDEAAGTFPLYYMAPEQTGHGMHVPDHRTDLYALGSMLYELLWGAPPFSDLPPEGLLQAILTAEPLPSTEATVDPAVRAMVLRLLHKDPRQRYANAAALRRDLRALGDAARADPFVFGESLLSRPTLYGRANEVALLAHAFVRARAGETRWVVISGAPGSGKSTVALHALGNQVTGPALCGQGKCDEMDPYTPYRVWRQVLATLTQCVFMHEDARVQSVRTRLRFVAGDYAGLLTTALPELSALLPASPAPPAMGRVERESRFRNLLLQVLVILSQDEQPLVLLFDDLQWADAASLQLLSAVAHELPAERLVMIAIYRDNAITPALAEAERAWRHLGNRLGTVHLGGLDTSALVALLTDMLGDNTDELLPLATLIATHTRGNAFSVQALLQQLQASNLLWYAPHESTWRWNLGAITAAVLAESATQYWCARLQHITGPAASIISIAACIGVHFETDLIAALVDLPLSETNVWLDDAVHQGIFLSQHGGFRFAHDCILQAAQTLVRETDRHALHLRIGRHLLMAPSTTRRTFDVVNQLNAAGPSAVAALGHPALLALNLQAGLDARLSAAHAPACHYLRRAKEHADEAGVTPGSELWHQVYLELAETLGFLGDLPAAELLYAALDKHLQGGVTRAAVQASRAEVLDAADQSAAAVDAALCGLKLLGIHLHVNTTRAHLLPEMVRLQLAARGKKPESVMDGPEAQSPWALTAQRLLCSLSRPAFYVNPTLYYLSSLRLVTITFQHGRSRYAALSYTAYAAYLTTMRDKVALGYKFARLAEAMLVRYPDAAGPTFVRFASCCWVRQLCEPLPDVVRALHGAYHLGMNAGDFDWAGFCAIQMAVLQLFGCGTLQDVVGDGDIYAADHRRPGHSTADSVAGMVDVARALSATTWNARTTDRPARPGLSDALLQSRNTSELLGAYLMGDLEAAEIYGQRAYAGCSASLRGHFLMPQACLYYGLTLLARLPHASGVRRLTMQRNLRRCCRELQRWSQRASINFLGDHLLLHAAVAHWRGKEIKAGKLFTAAITWYEHAGFTGKAALANELLARLLLAQGLRPAALAYFARAMQHYRAWGAQAKLTQLRQAFPELSDDMAESGALQSEATADALLSTTRVLAFELDLDKRVQTLMQALLSAAGAARGVLLVHQEGQLRVAAVSEGAGPPSVDASGAPALPWRLVRYVEQQRTPVLLDNAATHQTFGLDPYMAQAGAKSILCAPFLHQGNLMGLVFLENNAITGAFTPAKLDLITHFATQAAVSLQNALLSTHLEARVDERSRAFALAQKRVRALEDAHAEMQMAGGFAHEMRNALGAADILAASVDAQTLSDATRAAQQKDATQALTTLMDSVRSLYDVVTGMRRGIHRGLRLTDEVLAYAQLGAAMPGEGNVDIAAVIRDVVDDVRARPHHRDIVIALDLPNDVHVRGNRAHFHSLAAKLIANACEALAAPNHDTNPQVHITLHATPQTWTLSIRDTGAGIPAADKARIYDPFFSTKPSVGHGLGLAAVLKVVNLYGGEIVCDSVPMRGTTFTVTFPNAA